MHQQITEQEQQELKQNAVFEQKCPIPWWKRIGMLGFLFFFVKGLVWLVIFAIGWIWGPEAFESVKEFFSGLF